MESASGWLTPQSGIYVPITQGTLAPGGGDGSAPLPDHTNQSVATVWPPDNSHGVLAHRQTYAASDVAERKKKAPKG